MARTGDDRAAAPLVGNILLVGVVLVIAVALVTLSFAFLDRTGAPTAEASFEYEQTSAGLRMTSQALGTDVTVQLNGEEFASIDADSAGQSILVPTAPGDTITVVSNDEDRSVLVTREIDDRDEIGDFIAYYAVDSTSGDTLEDESGNGNDGTLESDGGSDPQWAGCGLRFDGSDDHVSVSDITTGGVDEVSEFTIAVEYEQTGGQGSVNQLVEHRFSGGEEWFMETSPNTGEPYSTGYSIDYAVEYPGEVASSTSVSMDTRHVVVGTYDGSGYELFVDGQSKASGSHSEAVEMGEMRFGRDFEGSSQYFEGEICEIRLYYTAFDSEDVERITEAMD